MKLALGRKDSLKILMNNNHGPHYEVRQFKLQEVRTSHIKNIVECSLK